MADAKLDAIVERAYTFLRNQVARGIFGNDTGLARVTVHNLVVMIKHDLETIDTSDIPEADEAWFKKARPKPAPEKFCQLCGERLGAKPHRC